MSQTTYTEKAELAQELAPLVKAEIAKEAKNVTDVELVESTQNISTLPAIYSVGGVKKVVRIATSTLVQETADKADSKVGTTIAAAEEATAACKAQTESAATEEASRVEAENSRVEAEASRVEVEAARVDAEAERADAEAKRKEAEASRVEVEASRVEAESSRVEVEASRVAAETAREEASATAVKNAEDATATCVDYNNHPTKIGDNGNWWKWNIEEQAYEDTGVIAKGGALYPTFTHEGNKLYLVDCPSELDGKFAKSGNKLTFDIAAVS